jgi:BlaI family penicillinase repressor
VRDADPPTDLQLAVLRALWALGEAAVPDVQAHLGAEGRRLAPTTVATVLRRMEKKGWVHHREEGRSFLYRAADSREEVADSALARITGALFGGDVPALVSQLIDSRAVTAKDLARIRKLIADKEKERR